MRILPLLIAVSAVVLACKPQVPDEYLQPGEFEDILYDYHLADAMAEGGDDASTRDYDQTLYRQAVLHKYGITQADFDSSLVYYMRHADRLHAIYENISKRLEDDAMALGASANDLRRYGALTSARDTSNLWTGAPAVMLMPQAPYNVMTFDIQADSTYHKGDKIIFSFNCDLVSRESGMEGVAVLAVSFKNDSVASSTTRMSSTSNYSVTVNDGDRQGIKSVRGFVYLGRRSRSRHDDGDGLCLMFLDNIRMVRMRAVDDKTPEQGTLSPTSRRAPVDTARRGKSQTVQPLNNNVMKATPMQAAPGRPLKMSDVNKRKEK